MPGRLQELHESPSPNKETKIPRRPLVSLVGLGDAQDRLLWKDKTSLHVPSSHELESVNIIIEGLHTVLSPVTFVCVTTTGQALDHCSLVQCKEHTSFALLAPQQLTCLLTAGVFQCQKLNVFGSKSYD